MREFAEENLTTAWPTRARQWPAPAIIISSVLARNHAAGLRTAEVA